MYSYGYYPRATFSGWQLIVGIIAAIVCTILLYVMVFPKSKEGKLPPFFAFVRNFFGLKYLVIEKIAKFFYVLFTMLCICVGFFLLFGRTFLVGLLLIILGTIVQRLFYELFMLTILLVKNVMEINAKLKGDSGSATNQFDAGFPVPPKAPAAPAAPVAPAAPAAPEDNKETSLPEE